jgi:hypothetical protein
MKRIKRILWHEKEKIGTKSISVAACRDRIKMARGASS